MNLYKELNLRAVRPVPDVWVSRIVIFRQITPEPVVVRDIPLTRGLNIIWAKEAEDDDSTAEMAGHSAGKTTFCRLLRYCLGETTFGTKAGMELIGNALPGGYVAAELHVRQQRWAVIRPIGKGRNSYIKPDATIAQLLEDRTRVAFQDTYPKELGLVGLLDDLETGGIVRTGESIQWGHILAWCARDQEARFQSIHEWRSPRSESESPSFRFPKADPLFVMRVVLGLFLPNELKGEEKLAKLVQEQEKLTAELEERKREPQFRVNLFDTQLRQRIRTALPDESHVETLPLHSGDLLPDLDKLTTRASDTLEHAIEQAERELRDLQDQIDKLGGRVQQREHQLNKLDELYGMNDAASRELAAGLSQRRDQLRLFDQYGDKKCVLGDILYAECERVRRRQQVLQHTQLQDAHAIEHAEAKRAEEQAKLDEDKRQLREEIEKLQAERQATQARRDLLQAGIREKRRDVDDLRQARQELETWTQKRDQPGGYQELDECRTRLRNTEAEVSKLEERLAKLLREHDEQRQLLAAIFSAAVRSVFPSGTFDGQVSLENRELAFSITRGPTMSGEAVVTLSVLLSDVSCLIFSTVSEKARYPGFLVHDCPREADLGARVYWSFLRFMGRLHEECGGAPNAPFQYIVTTTTPPPKELQGDRFTRVTLHADDLNGLLFCKDLGRLDNTTEGDGQMQLQNDGGAS